MATDKTNALLVDALKQALSQPGEQRLFKAGKMEGLFPARTGVHAEAAAQALSQGLLEVVRTDVKGKASIEWVRITPRGIDFLHEHESPVQVLEELQALLQSTQNGIPVWAEQMQEDLHRLRDVLTENVQKVTHHLQVLSQRVDDALRRADAAPKSLHNGAASAVTWAMDALSYLDRRQGRGMTGACSLPELFAAVHQHHGKLSITAFHEGLRRLQDRHALQLLPYNGPLHELTEPEHALLDGPTMLYYVSR